MNSNFGSLVESSILTSFDEIINELYLQKNNLEENLEALLEDDSNYNIHVNKEGNFYIDFENPEVENIVFEKTEDMTEYFSKKEIEKKEIIAKYNQDINIIDKEIAKIEYIKSKPKNIELSIVQNLKLKNKVKMNLSFKERGYKTLFSKYSNILEENIEKLLQKGTNSSYIEEENIDETISKEDLETHIQETLGVSEEQELDIDLDIDENEQDFYEELETNDIKTDNFELENEGKEQDLEEDLFGEVESTINDNEEKELIDNLEIDDIINTDSNTDELQEDTEIIDSAEDLLEDFVMDETDIIDNDIVNDVEELNSKIDELEDIDIKENIGEEVLGEADIDNLLEDDENPFEEINTDDNLLDDSSIDEDLFGDIENEINAEETITDTENINEDSNDEEFDLFDDLEGASNEDINDEGDLFDDINESVAFDDENINNTIVDSVKESTSVVGGAVAGGTIASAGASTINDSINSVVAGPASELPGEAAQTLTEIDRGTNNGIPSTNNTPSLNNPNGNVSVSMEDGVINNSGEVKEIISEKSVFDEAVEEVKDVEEEAINSMLDNIDEIQDDVLDNISVEEDQQSEIISTIEDSEESGKVDPKVLLEYKNGLINSFKGKKIIAYKPGKFLLKEEGILSKIPKLYLILGGVAALLLLSGILFFTLSSGSNNNNEVNTEKQSQTQIKKKDEEIKELQKELESLKEKKAQEKEEQKNIPGSGERLSLSIIDNVLLNSDSDVNVVKKVYQDKYLSLTFNTLIPSIGNKVVIKFNDGRQDFVYRVKKKYVGTGLPNVVAKTIEEGEGPFIIIYSKKSEGYFIARPL